MLYEVFGQTLFEFHEVGVLHVVRLLVGLAVKIYYAVLYLERLSWQSHAALHIVLAAVSRAPQQFAVLLRLAEHIHTTGVICHLVVLALHERRQGINIHLHITL